MGFSGLDWGECPEMKTKEEVRAGNHDTSAPGTSEREGSCKLEGELGGEKKLGGHGIP